MGGVNIDKIEGLLRDKFGIEISKLDINTDEILKDIQNRHLLVHKNGIIDERYINKLKVDKDLLYQEIEIEIDDIEKLYKRIKVYIRKIYEEMAEIHIHKKQIILIYKFIYNEKSY